MLVSGGRLIAISRHFILRGGGRAAMPSFLIASPPRFAGGVCGKSYENFFVNSGKVDDDSEEASREHRTRNKISNFLRCRGAKPQWPIVSGEGDDPSWIFIFFTKRFLCCSQLFWSFYCFAIISRVNLKKKKKIIEIFIHCFKNYFRKCIMYVCVSVFMYIFCNSEIYFYGLRNWFAQINRIAFDVDIIQCFCDTPARCYRLAKLCIR